LLFWFFALSFGCIYIFAGTSLEVA